MSHPLLFLSAALLGATIFLLSRWNYRYERLSGRSHQDSLRASAAFPALLLGSAAFDYVVVVSRYS